MATRNPTINAILRRLNRQGRRFDPDYDLGVQALGEQATFTQGERDIGRRRLGEDTGIARRRLSRQHDLDRRFMKNKFAGQGTLRSGIYTGALGDLGTSFQEGFGDIARTQTRGLEDYARGQVGEERGYGIELERLARAAALREEQRRKEEAERKARADALRSLGYG